MRYKQRYIVFTYKNNDPFKVIKQRFAEFYGKVGLADSGIKLISFNEKTHCGILRVFFPYFSKIKAVLALSVTLGFRVLGVSGTLKKAREKFVL